MLKESNDRSPSPGLTRFLLLSVFALIAITGCGTIDSFDINSISLLTSPTPTGAAVSIATAQVPEPDNVSEAAPPSTPVPNEPLTIWIPPDLPGDAEIRRQIDQFGGSIPQTEIRIESKKALGEGGLLDYLLEGETIAPSILPDLALVPAEAIPSLVTNEVIYPVNSMVEQEAIDDLFPAAINLSFSDQTLHGYPYAINEITHLVYNRDIVTRTIPTQWDSLLEIETVDLALPSTGDYAGILLLQFYLAEGGTLRDESGLLSLDREPLERALTHLEQGLATETISPLSRNVTSVEEGFRLIQPGTEEASVALVSSALYLNQLNSLEETADTFRFARIPGPDEPLSPKVTGWVWVITQPIDSMQPDTPNLLAQLIDPTNMSNYTLSAGLLPTRNEGFSTWPTDSYTSFVNRELERSTRLSIDSQGVVLEVLSNSVNQLLSSSSPTVAVPTIAADAANSVP